MATRIPFLLPLREFVAQQDASSNTKIRFEYAGDLPSLPAAVEVAAYRITIEAVTNVMRHAGAGNCTIQLRTKYPEGDAGYGLRNKEPIRNARSEIANQLCIEVYDDGSGLPPDVHPGVGLNSMRERALELGGTFEITSEEGQGTAMRAGARGYVLKGADQEEMLRNHLSNIFSKMRVADRVQAIIRAREAGLGTENKKRKTENERLTFPETLCKKVQAFIYLSFRESIRSILTNQPRVKHDLRDSGQRFGDGTLLFCFLRKLLEALFIQAIHNSLNIQLDFSNRRAVFQVHGRLRVDARGVVLIIGQDS
jgi:hypothetical protein